MQLIAVTISSIQVNLSHISHTHDYDIATYCKFRPSSLVLLGVSYIRIVDNLQGTILV